MNISYKSEENSIKMFHKIGALIFAISLIIVNNAFESVKLWADAKLTDSKNLV